jgi:hypothetical protein
MIKNKLRDMPVLYIHLEPGDKEALRQEAKKKGLQLTAYCRMLLLASLNKECK